MMAKLKMIVAGLVFFGVLVLGAGLIAQQNTGDGVVPMDRTIKALIEARIEVSKEICEAMMAPTRDGPLDNVPAWSRRWMDEQIGLDPDPTKKIAAIQRHLDRIKGLEEIAGERFRAARGTHADVLKMKYFRLEAEQMLAETRIINPGLFPPKPAAKP